MTPLERARNRFTHAYVARYMLILADRTPWIRYDLQFRSSLRYHLRARRA